MLDTPRRTRSQARQIVAFLQARTLGWNGPSERLAACGLERLIADCSGVDVGSWIETVDATDQPLDRRPDLYTQACVLLALASIQANLADDRALPLALQTLAFLDTHLADPESGGWLEASPSRLPRRQNPHMHLLEAMLAWMRVSGRREFRRTAEQVLSLFDARFRGADGSLIEHFGPDWTRHEALGWTLEPGHHAEWICLLQQSEMLGLGDRSGARHALYGRLRRQLVEGAGWAVNAVSAAEGVIDPGRRLWAQCEVLRAHLAMRDHAAAAATAEAILHTHLAAATPGLWIDAFDGDMRPRNGLVPASSFYHLTSAVLALME